MVHLHVCVRHCHFLSPVIVTGYLSLLCGKCQFPAAECPEASQSRKFSLLSLRYDSCTITIGMLPSQIFSRYEKHRELILEDIFASLARLPTTKRNLRNFKYVNTAPVQV